VNCALIDAKTSVATWYSPNSEFSTHAASGAPGGYRAATRARMSATPGDSASKTRTPRGPGSRASPGATTGVRGASGASAAASARA